MGKLNKGLIEGVHEPPGEPTTPRPEAPQKRKAKKNVRPTVTLPFLKIRRASDEDGKTEGKCWYCGDPTPFKDLYLIDWHPEDVDYAICRSICLRCILDQLVLPRTGEEHGHWPPGGEKPTDEIAVSTKKDVTLEYIAGLTAFEEREKFFDELFDTYCKHCGEPHPKSESGQYCQCWNDD